MDPERLIGGLIEGVLSGRRGRRRALRHLTGSGSLLSASNLLAAAGLVWGVYEAAQGAGTSPPLPPPGGEPAAPPAPGPDALRRIVRLTLSAARADGDLSLEERGRILEKAREVGAEELVSEELRVSHPLAEIVAGVSDPALKSELYTLAFSIVRSDDGVTGAERIYLAQLAHQLGLDPVATQALESAALGRGETQ